MDILIKNLRLPLYGGKVFTIYHDGTVEMSNVTIMSEPPKDSVCKAIELPPHGDLIERSPLVQKIKDEWQKIHEETGYDVKGIFWNKLVEIIESSEVVLEASNGSDN